MKNLSKTLFTFVIAIAASTGTANADVAASTTRIIDGQAVAIAGDCQGRDIEVRLYKLDAPSSRDGMPFWPGLDASICYGVWPGHAPKPSAGREVEPIVDAAPPVTGWSGGLALSAGLVDHHTMVDRLGGVGAYLRWEDPGMQLQFEGTIGGELMGRPTDWDFSLSIVALKKLDDHLRVGVGATYQLLLDKDRVGEEFANAHDFGGFGRLGVEISRATISIDGGAANVVTFRPGDERFDGLGMFGRAQLDIRFKRF